MMKKGAAVPWWMVIIALVVIVAALYVFIYAPAEMARSQVCDSILKNCVG